MSLINCPECGKEISDKAMQCPNCGVPIKKTKHVSNRRTLLGKERLRRNFGITNLVLGLLFLVMIITSDGGIENNTRMMGTSWILIWIGILGVFGCKLKWATIVSIVFYSIGITYNLVCFVFVPAHLIIAAMLIVFLVLVCVGLSDRKR